MLVEIVHIHKKLYSIWRQGEAFKDKIDAGKLRAVLVCAESLISWISPWKQVFQQNHVCLFIRGPGRLDYWENNAKKSRYTATLRR